MSTRPIELRSVTSDGTQVHSRVDVLKAVQVQAARRKAPRWLAVEVLLLELQQRGVELSLVDADVICRRIIAAEESPAFGA